MNRRALEFVAGPDGRGVPKRIVYDNLKSVVRRFRRSARPGRRVTRSNCQRAAARDDPRAALVIPMIVSKEFRVRLDTNTYSVPFEFVGKSVFLRADDCTVRVLCDGVEIARHVRSWDRRRHVEDPAHAQRLLDRRKAARGISALPLSLEVEADSLDPPSP